jgi:hypothetical protein
LQRAFAIACLVAEHQTDGVPDGVPHYVMSRFAGAGLRVYMCVPEQSGARIPILIGPLQGRGRAVARFRREGWQRLAVARFRRESA